MGDVTLFSDITAPLVGGTHLLYDPFDVQSQLKLWNLEMVERTVLPKVTASANDASLIVVELSRGHRAGYQVRLQLLWLAAVFPGHGVLARCIASVWRHHSTNASSWSLAEELRADGRVPAPL